MSTRMASLETTPTSVVFRSGNDVLPTEVRVSWFADSSSVAIGVLSEAEPNGLGVLITLEEVRRLKRALECVLDRADNS